MTQYKKDSEVVKEFEKQFAGVSFVEELEWQEESQFGCGLEDIYITDESLKSFLLQTRHDDREALLGEIEEWARKQLDIVLLSQKQLIGPPKFMTDTANGVKIALSDLLAYIKKLKS